VRKFKVSLKSQGDWEDPLEVEAHFMRVESGALVLYKATSESTAHPILAFSCNEWLSVEDVTDKPEEEE